jgi:CHAD domain-containing protein
MISKGLTAMPFEFNLSRPLSEEVPHLMSLQIGRMEADLRSRAPTGERIHDVRKRIKETRALMRLVREPLGSRFGKENKWYRNAGRDLSAARDAIALIESVDKLRKHSDDRATRKALRQIRHALQQSNADEAEVERHIQELLDGLDDARHRLSGWPKLPDRFATIGGGLQRSFRDGRRALAAVEDDPTPETFHELRKRVKDNWYHAQLLRRVWPDFMERYAEVIEDLSDALGDHHDLIVLRQTLTDDPLSFGDEAALSSAFSAIEKRRKQLEKKSVKVASHVYAEKPAGWRALIESWWEIAAK